MGIFENARYLTCILTWDSFLIQCLFITHLETSFITTYDDQTTITTKYLLKDTPNQQRHSTDSITVTSQWARWRLKSPASPLFTQPFIQEQMKEKSKLRITGLCAGNSPVTGEFPAQMAINAENVSIWWRHHAACSYRSMSDDDATWVKAALIILDSQKELIISLQWHHNGRDGVSNHQPTIVYSIVYLSADQRKQLKLRVTGLCEGNSPETGKISHTKGQ